jgi:hypothetical protein
MAWHGPGGPPNRSEALFPVRDRDSVMTMVCPRCRTTQDQRLYCPVCGVRLQHNDRLAAVDRPDSWLQRPWGRVLLGLMLAQGLYHGLRQLVIGLYLAGGGDGNLDPLLGLLICQGMQGVGLLVGALLAGAGQRSGAVLGAIVGFSNALVGLLTSAQAMPLTLALLFSLPLAQMTIGALSGWVGSLIWRPLPSLTFPGMSRQPDAMKDGPARPLRLFAGRIAWFRVAAGSALGVTGWLLAVHLFNALIEVANGQLGTENHTQDLLITWEVKALAVLLGGALGGINTTNGFKQGICVAILTTGILLIWPGHHWSMVIALFTVVSTFCLCVAGGWFGGQLLPPVAKYRGRRRLGPI